MYFALLRLTFVFYDLHRKPRAPFELLADKVVDTEELTSAFTTFSDVNDCLMLGKTLSFNLHSDRQAKKSAFYRETSKPGTLSDHPQSL